MLLVSLIVRWDISHFCFWRWSVAAFILPHFFLTLANRQTQQQSIMNLQNQHSAMEPMLQRQSQELAELRAIVEAGTFATLGSQVSTVLEDRIQRLEDNATMQVTQLGEELRPRAGHCLFALDSSPLASAKDVSWRVSKSETQLLSCNNVVSCLIFCLWLV